MSRETRRDAPEGGPDWCPRILVVDDEEHNLDFLRRAISRNFEVLTASNGAEALRILGETEHVVLIVTDQRMPGMSGTEFLEKAYKIAPDAVRILMTAYADYDAVVAAVNLGKIWSYVQKPVSPSQVRAFLDSSLELYRVRMENRRLTEELWATNRRLQEQRDSLRERLDMRSRELEEVNRSLEQLAVRDGLTGLYRHRFFQERLVEELSRAKRHGRPLSLILVDLDNFKAFNEIHGHQRGDEVLRRAGDLLTGRADPNCVSFRVSDVVARHGVDVFAVALPECPKGAALMRAEQLRACFEEHLAPSSAGPLTVSVGIGQFPVDAQTREQLVDCAEQALFRAKRDGRNRAVAFYPGLLRAETSLGTEQLADAEALADAMRVRAFHFHYQPIIHLDSRRPFGFEALCRTSFGRFRSPASLFSAAERLGLMPQLGSVLRDIIYEELQKTSDDRPIFVNIHPTELFDVGFMSDRMYTLAHRIILEITETAAIDDFERVSAVIKDLQKCGFRIALDDFGAGYSGIHRVAQLAPDLIKLDIGLVSAIGVEPRTSRLVSHVVEFANDEGIQVVAEGIETTKELDAVMALGCDLGQGYLLGKPGPHLGDQVADTSTTGSPVG